MSPYTDAQLSRGICPACYEKILTRLRAMHEAPTEPPHEP